MAMETKLQWQKIPKNELKLVFVMKKHKFFHSVMNENKSFFLSLNSLTKLSSKSIRY